MRHAIDTIIGSLRRLVRQCDGNVAMLFGLCAIPAVIGAGMAIDVGRAYMVKIRLGAALDAAALAVGSESGQTQTQLQTDLQNYFTANYPSTALGTNVSVAPVPANADLTAAIINWQAQATVPMTVMQLVGIDNITVTVAAQTKKTIGLEIAVVLDNTGSMLCGANEGAASTCGADVVSTDTTCTNSSNHSRICTLINAAKAFINVLTDAINASQQLYISIVPYVTTVNVAGSLNCTDGTTSCGSQIRTDSCSNDFLDDRLNLIYHAETVWSTKSTATVTATLTNGGATASTIASTSNILVVMAVSGTGIPSNTYVKTVPNSTSITLSANYTGTTGSGKTLTLGPAGNMDSTPSGSFTGSTVLNFPTAPSPALTAGMVVTGNGIPSNTAIQTVNSTTQITLCKTTTAASPGALSFYKPVTYDAAYNTASPAGSSTSSNWGGCVIEPTSSGENSGAAAVENWATANPDTTEPSSSLKWDPYWWGSAGANTWVGGTNSIHAQDAAHETQGQEQGEWLAQQGPNQGCPVPLLPLTDVTATAGKNTVLNTIGNMWTRDAGGTQVHIGMVWGWRTLSPNGPFAANNGHPLSYSNASTTGWKKVVVLMTDGQEEWPATDNKTGLGQIADGKAATTSSTSTAATNLGTRLTSVCSNMAASGDFIIYTIGLGNNGATNTQLQNCATTSNGGFFEAATPTNLQKVFNDVAKSLIALRLSQ
ncbi:MAG: pilus assembly protein TadG-related protein [Stellaceae bacterium]